MDSPVLSLHHLVDDAGEGPLFGGGEPKRRGAPKRCSTVRGETKRCSTVRWEAKWWGTMGAWSTKRRGTAAARRTGHWGHRGLKDLRESVGVELLPASKPINVNNYIIILWVHFAPPWIFWFTRRGVEFYLIMPLPPPGERDLGEKEEMGKMPSLSG